MYNNYIIQYIAAKIQLQRCFGPPTFDVDVSIKLIGFNGRPPLQI